MFPAMLGPIVGSLIGGAANIGLGLLNNEMSQAQASRDRLLNYEYGEKAAENADKRTRALYKDIYSPSALLRQYNEAGLSPSMMFGGTPGQGGMSGASAAGAATTHTQFMPMSMIEGAQIANLMAQTAKTKAETKNIDKDTSLKGLEEEWNRWRNYERNREFNLINNMPIIGPDGQTRSMFELANYCDDYEQFVQIIRNQAEEQKKSEIIEYLQNETGQRTLRNIYMSANRFDRDIKILSEEGVSADFQKSVLKCMNKEGIAEQKAETLIQMLKAEAETSKLTVQQAGAWNDILERMGRKNETAKDILIVLSMIFNQAATNWKFFE